MNPRISDNQFTELIDENKGLIHKICLFYTNKEDDRQDLFQDIVLQAWKNYSSFRNQSKFSTWLYRIALNTALYARRKAQPVVAPLSEDIENATFQKPENEPIESLHVAIRTLNEIEKSLVLLYLDGYSYEEMEHITGISNGALRVKMSRIKQKLKTLVK